jgi:hypothetical protein
MDEPSTVTETIELSVRESHITRPGGIRMNTTTYRQLGLDEQNNKIDVSTGATSLIRRAYPDDNVGYQDIFLRKDARAALHVSEHDIVNVSRHKSLGTAARERLTGPKKQAEIHDQTIALEEY